MRLENAWWFLEEGADGQKILREDDPGAIQIGFRPDVGWGESKHKWFSLKRMDKLLVCSNVDTVSM